MKKLKIIVPFVFLSIIVFVLMSPKEKETPIYLSSFSFVNLEGEMTNINEYTGSPLVINFWATWCSPCRREMPLLNNIHTVNADKDLKVIGIAIDEIDLVRDFVNELGIEFPILVGQGEAYDLMNSLGNSSMTLPYTIYVESDGLISWTKNTEIKFEDLDVLVGEKKL